MKGTALFLYELVQLVLFYYIKSYTQCTEVVDGSNESLYHANEEFDPNLCTGVPLQKSFEKVDVRKFNRKVKNVGGSQR